MNAVLRQFVLKDLYFARITMVGAIVIALLAIPLLALGPMGRYAAFLAIVFAGIAPAFFICGWLIVSERKERAHLFNLSLPISGAQAIFAKGLAAGIAYLAPWLVLMVGTFALFSLTHAPKGLLPFGTMTWVFLFDQFCVVLAVTLSNGSESLYGTVVVAGNLTLSFYFYAFLSQPGIGGQLSNATAVWTPLIVHTIEIELLAAVALLAFTFWQVSRRKDFI